MDNEQLLQEISDMLDKKLDEKLDKKLDEKLDEKLEPIKNRMDKLESQVSALQEGQLEIRKETREINRKVSETYQLALDAWGKSTENRLWLENGIETAQAT